MPAMQTPTSQLLRCAFLMAGVCCALVLPSTSHADTDAERSALAQLVYELDALGPLIITAAAQADPDTRIRFQYDWLRQDLARIRLGIEEHLNAPQAEPRRFPPVRGDYRR